MQPSRIIAIGLLLGVTGGMASGAPTTAKKTNTAGRRFVHTCEAPPDKAKCLEKFYLDDCGHKYRATCRPYFEGELQGHYDGNPSPLVTMFKPKKHEIPVGLREGKTVEYPGPKATRMLGTVATIGTVKRPRKAAGKTTIKAVPKSAMRPPLYDDAATRRLTSPRGGAKTLGTRTVDHGMRMFTSDNVFARTGLTRPPHTGLGMLPVNAHRAPAWDANGGQVRSCEEYGYEKVYDWGRYTDAVAACAGDKNCQMDIAFLPATPGIADRTLQAKDGTPLQTQIVTAKQAKLPKNDFFLVGSKFVYAGDGGTGPLEKTPELEALAAALEAGKEHYEIGSSKYPTEWEFHRKLHDSNRTITQAEFEEYELRKAKFRELLQKWQWAAASEEAKLKGNWKAVHQWVAPIDMVSNPFERAGQLEKMSRKLQRGAASLRKQGLVDRNGALTDKGRAALTKNKAKTQRSFSKGARIGKAKAKDTRTPKAKANTPSSRTMGPTGGSTTPTTKGSTTKGGMGPTNSTSPRGGINKLPGTTSSVQPTALMGFVPKSNKPSSSQNPPAKRAPTPCDPKNFPHVQELFGVGPLSCQLGRMLRQEWRRKANGWKSCLDPDDDDCDWSPMMFEQRFTKGVPYIDEQQRHETYCIDWTNDNIDRPTLADAKAYIDQRKAELEKILKKLKPYQTEPSSNRSFGKEWVDADHFGDKDMFAAGYDYDLGWDIAVVDAQGGNVCELGAGARGGFGVDGWFISNQFEVVDGRAQADWNRAGNDQGDLDIHLRVFSVDVFDPVDEHFQGAWEEPLFTNSINIPTGYKPSFTVMAGPVPITGAVWGEFFYGAKFGIQAVSQAPNCDMSQLKFGVEAKFTPELGLNAKAQVGVGISGLLSAGIRGMVNLVTVGVPVVTTFSVVNKQVENTLEASLGFDLDVQLSLGTLSGWLAVYVELLFFEEEFVLFRWNGVGPETISLLGEPLHAELPLFVMGK